MTKDKNLSTKGKETNGDMIALKEFKAQHNEIIIDIKKGDDISKLDLPEGIITNLKTEGVLKGK